MTRIASLANHTNFSRPGQTVATQLLLLAVFCFPSVCHSEVPLSQGRETQDLSLNPVQTTEMVRADYEALQKESRQNIARLREQISTIQRSSRPVPAILVHEFELWQQFELVTQERRSTQEYLGKHQSSKSLNPFRKGGLQIPRSYLELDELRETLDSREQALDALGLELQSEKMLTREARSNFDANEQYRRRLDEDTKSSEAREKINARLQQTLVLLKSRVLESQLSANREQVLLLEYRIENADAEVAVIRDVLGASIGKFRLTRDELSKRLQFIDDRETEVRAQLAEVDARLRATMHDDTVTTGASENTAYELAREESQLLRQLLSGVGNFKETWRRRYLLSNNQVSAEEIEIWLDEAEQAKLRTAQIGEKLRLRTRQRQESLSLLQRSALTPNGPAVDQQKLIQRRELERILEFYGSVQVLIGGGERLCQRQIEDLEMRQNKFSLSDNLDVLKGMALSSWQYEIATIDDEPITIRKLVIGLSLLLFGYFISRAIASMIAFRVLPRFGVSRAAASVLRTVLLYLMMVALVFISLDVVSVPLTVFAFLGGAVAIGVGFGSQNLINNFISGLILLVERPIRIGDLVNVDGIDANVEHIGARSTRIRTGANLEILVPNSKFLENNVTNWTLSDTKIRTSVNVGVAYGSPVRRVMELLHQVIEETEGALTTPKSIVLFQNFGDNSLDFEVHYWVQMRHMMDGAKVRSEVRAAIDEFFRAEGITIAYPQRDVHIDMQSPIEVRMADPGTQQNPASRLRAVRRAA